MTRGRFCSRKIKYALGPDRSRLRRLDLRARDGFKGSAQSYCRSSNSVSISGAFPEDRRLPIDELFIDTQPAHLQKSSQQKLNAEERDHLRAQIIRERLKLFPKPDISKMAKESGNGSTAEPSNNE